MLDDVKRDRALIAGAVEHRNSRRLAVIGERRGGVGKPGVVVVMRQADQRHALGKPELAGEDFWRPRHLVEAAAVEAGGLRGAHELETLRQLLDHRARQRAGERRIIPAREPGVDIADIAADLPQRRHRRVDRQFRIFGRVLVAGKALFLVVDDQSRPVRLRHLDQRQPRIMRAGSAEAGEIDRLAACELGAHMRDPRIGEFRAELVKSRSPHGFRRQPARGAEADAGEPGMPRTNSCVLFQPCPTSGPCRHAEY